MPLAVIDLMTEKICGITVKIICCWWNELNTVVLIPCTDRKRILPAEELCARNLSVGAFEDVAKDWGRRVRSANDRVTPNQLYCGRAFKEARTASNLLGAELCVISAGHGIIRQDQSIPPYGLTVAPGKRDSVQPKIADLNWSSARWWQALGEYSPASVSLSDCFRDAAADLVLIALSGNYAKLLAAELAGLDEDIAQRIRVFGAGLASHVPENIEPCLMPYDVRLNGRDSPIRGTMSDFPTRALHHYAMRLECGQIEGRSLGEDKRSIANELEAWSVPEIPVRKKMSDDDVISFIVENWEATNGRSGVSLRLLRDSGNACEQGRFKDLFKLAATDRSQFAKGDA